MPPLASRATEFPFPHHLRRRTPKEQKRVFGKKYSLAIVKKIKFYQNTWKPIWHRPYLGNTNFPRRSANGAGSGTATATSCAGTVTIAVFVPEINTNDRAPPLCDKINSIKNATS
jgi:hypothetical protein